MVVTEETLQAGYDYIKRHPAVREVLISGGDPLLLPDNKIKSILTNLKAIRITWEKYAPIRRQVMKLSRLIPL